MKKRPKLAAFDPERFIAGAATVAADAPAAEHEQLAEHPPPRARSPRRSLSQDGPARPQRSRGSRSDAPAVPVRSGSKLPAAGFVRRSFDFPDDLFRRFKIAAVEDGRPMRECLEEALLAWLQRR